MFRVTRPYLNLLVKPRNFLGFLGKNIILSILKGEMQKILFFPEKKIIKKKTCVPTQPKIFRPVTQNTLIFLFGLIFRQIVVCLQHSHFSHYYQEILI